MAIYADRCFIIWSAHATRWLQSANGHGQWLWRQLRHTQSFCECSSIATPVSSQGCYDHFGHSLEVMLGNSVAKLAHWMPTWHVTLLCAVPVRRRQSTPRRLQGATDNH